MGWTFTRRERGISHLEFFKREFGDNVLEAAGYPGVVYLAYQTKDNGAIGIVCLIKWTKEDGYNFGYKDMDETMGPCETAAPEKIIRLLTGDPLNAYAHEWRRKCWEEIERKKQLKNRPHLKRGDIITISPPVKYNNGMSGTVFTVIDPANGEFLISIGDYKGSTIFLRKHSLENISEIMRDTGEVVYLRKTENA